MLINFIKKDNFSQRTKEQILMKEIQVLSTLIKHCIIVVSRTKSNFQWSI